jgi:hypothetical protein
MAFDVGRNTTFRRQEMPSYKVITILAFHSAPSLLMRAAVSPVLHCAECLTANVQLYALQAQRPEHPRDILLQEPLALAMMTALGCPCYSMVSVKLMV